MSDSTPMRRCKQCGNEYPATTEYFYRTNVIKGVVYLRAVCIPCYNAEKNAEDRAQRRDPVLGERIRKQQREYYSANRERISANSRASLKRRMHKNPEKVRIVKRKWSAEHRDITRASGRKWYSNNTEQAKSYANSKRAREQNLPNDFKKSDWIAALKYFEGCCAVCGRPPGLWHTLAADHWIPITAIDCPGTVAHNIVPLCHGQDGCNNSKRDKNAQDWLLMKYGKRKGKSIYRRITAYLNSVR